MSAARHLAPPWRPGQSGNPGGRTALPPELRAIKSLSQQEICKLVSKYARMAEEDLADAFLDKKTSVIEKAIASIFNASIKHGDYTRLAFLLDRAIGKVAVVQETDEEKAAREELQSLSTLDLLRLVKEKLPEMEGVNKPE